MAQSISHTLWVVNVSARDFLHKSIPGAILQLNQVYMANCVGNVGQFTIGSAQALQGGPRVVASPLDAVVFLVRDVGQSVTAKLGANLSAVISNPKVLGHTLLGATGGGCAEVYWDRCYNDGEVARAIFHEAAHLKSGMDNSMHTVVVGGPHGGSGLRVLSAPGASYLFPSEDDLDFYQKAITRNIVNRTQAP